MTHPALERVTDNLYWLPPAKPDRPSLAAVVGKKYTLMLDIGASSAHTGQFSRLLEAAPLPTPDFAVLSHGHWDHVFGMSALEIPICAHTGTAKGLEVLRGYDWSDEALDARVSSGEEAEMCARDIRLKLPSPRTVTPRAPDIVFREALEFDLGGVVCRILHVGGDQAADACIVHALPDGLVFLGDCLYEAIYAPARYYNYTPERISPLLERVLALDAERYITGHGGEVMSRRDLEAWAAQVRRAYALCAEPEPEDLEGGLAYDVQLFRVGQGLE